MVATDRIGELFADARGMYESALERMAQGDVRDAAEKAWCATLLATNALILARTGDEPQRTPGMSIELGKLAHQDRAIQSLTGRYYSRQGQLHGECFYLGLCEPVAQTERRIRDTIVYVQDAEVLART